VAEIAQDAQRVLAATHARVCVSEGATRGRRSAERDCGLERFRRAREVPFADIRETEKPVADPELWLDGDSLETLLDRLVVLTADPVRLRDIRLSDGRERIES